MKQKYWMGLVAAAMLVSGGKPAMALTWTDVDSGYPLALLRSSNPSYSSTFNINDDGFNSATMQVNSAIASFAFADDLDSQLEYVNITIDGLALITGQETDGSHLAYAWYSQSLSGTMLGSLNADGILSYTVTVTSGDTYLKVAKLCAQGGMKDTNRVPDGGMTLLMLGSTLTGLGVWSRSRKFTSVK